MRSRPQRPTSIFFGTILLLLFLTPTIQQEESKEIDDDAWMNYGTQEMYNALNCEQNRLEEGGKLTIHTQEIWKLLQDTYTKVVGEEKSSLPKGGFLGIDGFYVGYTIEHGEHGRGVFAKHPIEEGKLVWKSIQTARFDSGADYRRYLKALPAPLACDVLHWAYTRVEDLEENDDEPRVVICVDLDPGSLVNECPTEEECNLEITVPRGTGCRLDFHATRDIESREELRIDYAFSEFGPGWAALGLRNDVPPLTIRVVELDDDYDVDEAEDAEEESTDEDDFWPTTSGRKLASDEHDEF